MIIAPDIPSYVCQTCNPEWLADARPNPSRVSPGSAGIVTSICDWREKVQFGGTETRKKIGGALAATPGIDPLVQSVSSNPRHGHGTVSFHSRRSADVRELRPRLT